MDLIPLTPERKAQLEDYARRHGQDTAAALDTVLADYLEWEQQDYTEAMAAVTEAYKSVQAGRTRLVEESLEELRVKHGLPR
jgi:hypothetical protein